MEGKDAINILGREWDVKIPPQFAVCEELVVAFAEAGEDTSLRLRACGAILGICTKIGNEAKADYVKAGFKPLAYGGAVYGWLRQSGATPSQVFEQAVGILERLNAKVFPRESEVAERAGFSGPAGGE